MACTCTGRRWRCIVPPTDKTSLALLGQVLFAASGLEYIAIMAGETHGAEQQIGRSVVFSTPIIFLMFVLGTAAVVSFHEVNAGVAINYVAPIPQTLALAFGTTRHRRVSGEDCDPATAGSYPRRGELICLPVRRGCR